MSSLMPPSMTSTCCSCPLIRRLVAVPELCTLARVMAPLAMMPPTLQAAGGGRGGGGSGRAVKGRSDE
jgi:hypothetical protein